jgi:hypothetical protein
MQPICRLSVCALLALSLPPVARSDSSTENVAPQPPLLLVATFAGCAEAVIGPAYDAVVEYVKPRERRP